MSRTVIRTLFAPVFALAVVLVPVSAQAIEIQRVISKGGVEAWLVEDHSLPIISMRFLFPGGAATDPVGREGTANMVSGLLDEGAGDLDSQIFQSRLADESISLSFNASRDNFGGGLKALTRNRDEAFGLLRLALTQPRFDTDAVERIRTQILTGISAHKNDPNRIAQRTFWAAIFPGHPYARPNEGTAESVAAITDIDMRTFVTRRLARSELIVGIVGDIRPDDLKLLLDTTFSDLPERAEAFTIPKAEPAASGEVIVVRKNNPQSRVLFGQKGVYRDDPDYYAALVLNHVLGGGSFTSRLYDEIREKRGLAYSVFSYLLPLENAALWLGGAGTENSAVSVSVELVRNQWENVRTFGVTQDELDKAKANLTGSFGLRFDNTSAISGMLVAVQRHNLGIEYLNERNGLIERVTLENVNRVAKRILDPAALTVVVVGDPENIDATHIISDDG
ncbi:MAG: pitrilysin family protein [Alphaproteobacteria bacterium]|nr:pitrilysin family protein [Alphaproteobacteria bacterium]